MKIFEEYAKSRIKIRVTILHLLISTNLLFLSFVLRASHLIFAIKKSSYSRILFDMKSVSGFSILSVLITIALTSILAVSFNQRLIHSVKFERGIASNIDLDEIASTVRLIIGSRDFCEKSGLIGIDISPLLETPPQPVSINLHLPGSNGPGAVYLSAGQSFTRTRSILSLQLSSTTLVGPPALGQYFATIALSTKITGQAITSRTPNMAFYIALTTDSANRIVRCGASEQTSRRFYVNLPVLWSFIATSVCANCSSLYCDSVVSNATYGFYANSACSRYCVDTEGFSGGIISECNGEASPNFAECTCMR